MATSTSEQHGELFNIVSKRLRRANLTINLEKCQFFKPNLRYLVRYLGYVVTQDGFARDPEKNP